MLIGCTASNKLESVCVEHFAAIDLHLKVLETVCVAAVCVAASLRRLLALPGGALRVAVANPARTVGGRSVCAA